MLRFHTQTAGSTLAAQQPDNNIVKESVAAVLGGTQLLHTNSKDEALGALPACKDTTGGGHTKAILPDTVDPLAGSYYIETLTDKLENKAAEQ